MKIRPIDIARKLNISTGTLRHYEAWGIIPPVARLSNGYRDYTEEHVAYFTCVRGMEPGFGIKLSATVLKSIQVNDLDTAIQLIVEAQTVLMQEKKIAEKTIGILDSIDFDSNTVFAKGKLSIGDVSREIGIPTSAIRHWEQIGLISPYRDDDNGYRLFDRNHVRQLLLIRTLRTSNYSLETIKRVLNELDDKNTEEAKKIAQDSLCNLIKKSHEQLHGAHCLFVLCQKLGLYH